MDHLQEWFPKDWRLQLFLGLTDTSWTERVACLRKADSLRPDEPAIAYHLALAYLERDDSLIELQARPYIERALIRQPENAVLTVMLAYVLLRGNEIGKARALFMDARRLPGGDFFYPRMEQLLLGLFSDARYLNPYTLTEAVEIYRRIPFPPFEKLINILYSVFLSPLPDHPYDIRLRGRDAARALFKLGGRLRVQAYAGGRVLTSGYEQQAMGFMFQMKAAEFLTLFYQAFEDSAGADSANADLTEVQKEYAVFQAGQPWKDTVAENYLENWSRLIKDHPERKLSHAVKEAETWGLWRRAMSLRYPSSDNP